MPGKSSFDESKGYVCVAADDSSHEASVLIALLALDADLLGEDEIGCELLCFIGEVCATFGTVDPFEADSGLLATIVDGDRVPIRDPDDLGLEGLSGDRGGNREDRGCAQN